MAWSEFRFFFDGGYPCFRSLLRGDRLAAPLLLVTWAPVNGFTAQACLPFFLRHLLVIHPLFDARRTRSVRLPSGATLVFSCASATLDPTKAAVVKIAYCVWARMEARPVEEGQLEEARPGEELATGRARRLAVTGALSTGALPELAQVASLGREATVSTWTSVPRARHPAAPAPFAAPTRWAATSALALRASRPHPLVEYVPTWTSAPSAPTPATIPIRLASTQQGVSLAVLRASLAMGRSQWVVY